jgi:hypothetical protein
MQGDLPSLVTYLQELCERAIRETDPVQREKLSAEIYRTIDKNHEIESGIRTVRHSA